MSGSNPGNRRTSGDPTGGPDADSRHDMGPAAHLPFENPSPVLRIDASGVLRFANPASRRLLAHWDLIVDEPAPEVLRGPAAEALASGKDGEIETLCGASYFLLTIHPVPERGYVNIYGHDITSRVVAEAESRRSRRLFKRMADATPDLLYLFNVRTGCNEFMNSRVENVLGYSRDRFGAFGLQLLSTLVHPEDLPMVRDQLSRLEHIAEGDILERECRVRHADGSYRWLWTRETVFSRGPDGRLELVLGVGKDVTSRRQIEDALRRSEERFRVAQELSLDAFTILSAVRDPAGRIRDFRWEYVNPQAGVVLQRSPEELVGEHLLQVLPGNRSSSDLFDRYVRVVETGQPHDIELAYESDGINGWFRNMTVKLGDGIAVYFSDITARKRVELELRRSNQQLELLASVAGRLLASPRPQEIVDALGRDVMSHLDCQFFLNYLLHESGEYLTLNASAGLPEHIASRIQRLEVGTTVCGAVAMDGGMRVLENLQELTDPSAALLRSLGARAYACHPLVAQGTVIGTIGFGLSTRDRFTPEEIALTRAVADQVAVALERGRLLEATQRRAAEIDEARRQAESASQAKDRFLAILSHELRTPLTPALSSAQLLELDPTLTADQRELIETIHRNVELEARLIDDLLDLTRISRGKLTLRLRPTDLHEQLAHVVQICSGEIEGKALQVTVDPRASRCHVQADPARLQQILWNLLRNAVKFTPRGGRIAVETSDDRGRIHVSIRDNGIGIAPQRLGRLFEPFEQGGDSVTRSFGGLGLGLSISKGLADLHGGTITASSDGEGRGSTFVLTLPLIPVPEAGTPAPARQTETAGAECRVLLVEDHPDTARILARLLSRQGYVVRVAGSVAAALECADKEAFDILVSDIGLPDGSGLDLMRALVARQPIRGIALSGYGQEEDVRRSRDAGFSEHLVKPVEFSALLDAIRRLNGASVVS